MGLPPFCSAPSPLGCKVAHARTTPWRITSAVPNMHWRSTVYVCRYAPYLVESDPSLIILARHLFHPTSFNSRMYISFFVTRVLYFYFSLLPEKHGPIVMQRCSMHVVYRSINIHTTGKSRGAQVTTSIIDGCLRVDENLDPSRGSFFFIGREFETWPAGAP